MQNYMRNRIIALLKSTEINEVNSHKIIADSHYLAFVFEKFADCLIKNGVIAPPVKVGEKVYAVGTAQGSHVKECTVLDFTFESAEKFYMNVCFECDDNCDGCYFHSWSQSHCGEWSCDGEYGNGLIPVDHVGKTVFLTPEQAEEFIRRS